MKRRPTESELMEIAQRNGWPLAMVEELIRDSAISEQVLLDARVGFVDDAKAAAKRFGKTAKEWKSRVPAWFVPYYIPFHRDPVTERAKPTTPFVTKEKKEDGTTTEKVQKYAQAHNSGVHVLYGPSLLKDGGALNDTSKPIVITEGEKKTLACESAGVSCIGLGGVNSWHLKGQRTLHPELLSIEWDGKTAYIAFDFDALYNAKVREQETALGRALEARGAKVYIIRFTPEAPKLDDYLATHDVREFHQLMEDAREHGALPPDTAGAVGAPAEATALTDLGNAERMVKQHGNDLRYCEAIGAWYIWTGKWWERDTTQMVIRRAMKTARSIYAEADAASDPDARATIRQHAKTSEAQARLSAMVKLTSVMRSISVKPENFDSDPWVINCENGTVDLRTGELRKHSTDSLVTKTTGNMFLAEAQHPRWTSFLEQVTGGDEDLILYLQRAAGYSITGDTSEDRFFFLYGDGGTGKGTFVTAITAALGDYARSARSKAFLESKQDTGGDKPRPDLVRLMGSRLVVCDEIKEGARFDEELVLAITGGSKIPVRTLNKEEFEMRPSFKLWLAANDPPRVSPEATGMWRRMVRIPFDHKPTKKDVTLRVAMREDPEIRVAVLAWLVRGVQAWREHGLVEPPAVKASTAAYRREMDPTGEFFANHCAYDPDARTPRKVIREEYERWCKEEGHTPQLGQRFAKRIRAALRAFGVPQDQQEVNVKTFTGFRGLEKTYVWQDAWRGIRLLTEAERAAANAWGGTAEQSPAQGELGGLGAKGTVGGPIHTSANCTDLANSRDLHSGQLLSPQSPQSPQEGKKEEENREVGHEPALGTSAPLGTSDLPNGLQTGGDHAKPDNDNAKSGARRRL